MFYREFYNKSITVDKAVDALNAWLREHAVIGEDTNEVRLQGMLQFVPSYDLLVPHIVDIAEIDGLPADILRVHFTVVLGEWNEEQYEEVLYKEYLPRALTDFFGVCDPEKDLIRVTTGLGAAQFMMHKNPRRLVSYPPCTCKGCDSPICPVRKRRR